MCDSYLGMGWLRKSSGLRARNCERLWLHSRCFDPLSCTFGANDTGFREYLTSSASDGWGLAFRVGRAFHWVRTSSVVELAAGCVFDGQGAGPLGDPPRWRARAPRALDAARPEAFGPGAIDLRRDRRPRPHSRLGGGATGGPLPPDWRRVPPIAARTKQGSRTALQRGESLSACAPPPSNGANP